MKPRIRRVLYLGSKELGLCALKAMHAASPGSLIGIVTYNDSQETRTKLESFQVFAKENGIPFYLADNNKHAQEIILRLKPELCFVVQWYWLFSTETLKSVPFGFIIVHNSLLPRYRGCAPLVWAMIHGEPKVGFTLFSPGGGIDDGPVWGRGEVKVGKDDYIGDVLVKSGKRLMAVIRQIYPKILNHKIKPRKQSNIGVTFGAQRLPEDGNINWNKPAGDVCKFIRAQSDPYPGAFTYFGSKAMKIWRAKPYAGCYYGTPGQVAAIDSQGVYVICGDDRAIILQEIEIDGRREKPQDIIRTIKIRFSEEGK